MITVESACKSMDIMTGIFVLALICIFGICMFIINSIEKREHERSLVAIEKAKKEMEKDFRIEMTKAGSRKFVELYEAKETIRGLEKQLRKTEDELERLKSAVERWQNGQK